MAKAASAGKIIEAGIKAGGSDIYEEDKIWSRYSHDKVDIGESLAKVIRTLNRAFPLAKPLRALSVGSSAEPQFRILETNFLGGLYLLDIEKSALDIVRERLRRQCTGHVTTIPGDYNKIFLNSPGADLFLKQKLGGKRIHLVTLHHSLYYCPEAKWNIIFGNLYRKILDKKAAIHAVLMSSKSKDPHTTTWLYNHFAGKFFGHHNDQDLRRFKNELARDPIYKNARIYADTHRVRFCVSDFSKFMAVVWMVLLYPSVHKYNQNQKEEITEFIYRKFWLRKMPLFQEQDHLVVYKGLGFKGLSA